MAFRVFAPSLPVAELDHDLLEDLKTKSPSVHPPVVQGKAKGYEYSQRFQATDSQESTR